MIFPTISTFNLNFRDKALLLAFSMFWHIVIPYKKIYKVYIYKYNFIQNKLMNIKT